MKRSTTLLLSASAGALFTTGLAIAQDAAVRSHIEAARKAAGKEHAGIFEGICTQFATPVASNPRQAAAAARPSRASGPPDRAVWQAEPVKVFDNLYFVGEKEYGAWAVTTSEGIIVIDAIFDYSVSDQIVGGLRKLGLDPATIKYVIVSHAHRDHVGGAGYLQEHFGARVIMAADDWALLDRTQGSWLKARRDMVATDGQKLTLGDTTITMYVTPGHTLGTLSLLVPVKDNGKPHLAASWGGTGFNWLSGSPIYITPDRPSKFWFDTYIHSANRFRDIVARAGADVLIANHTHLDDSKNKLPLMAKRRPSDAHPYVIGNDAVVRYVTVASECAQAGLASVALAGAESGRGELQGTWEFVWQTPGGERRSTLTFTQSGEKVEARFADAKDSVAGTLEDGKLSLAGRLYSSEAGEAADFHLKGMLAGGHLKGTGGWGEHQLTFTARKQE
jgi:metallo-beta-lactamase class B